MLSTSRFILLLLILSQGLSAFAQNQTKQAMAEEAANRIVKRFIDELDFGIIYREMYVTNPSLRKAEVEIIMGNMIRQGDALASYKQQARIEQARTIDFESMQRAYISLSNFHWLSAAAVMTHEGDDEKFKKTLAEAYEKYLAPMNDKKQWPILTNSQLDEKMSARFDGIADFLRANVDKRNFDSPEFKRREAAIEESRPPEVEAFKELFAPAGLKQSDDLYVVRRGRFYFYLLDENGEFRMLTWTDRIRF